MHKNIIYRYIAVAVFTYAFAGCAVPKVTVREENKSVPSSYGTTTDSTNNARVNWHDFFSDPYLSALIDTAIRNNQEINITRQELEIARNEVRARKGEYQPFVSLGTGAGVDKVPRYTNIGAMEANTEIKPGKEMPEPLGDFGFAARATWEVDIWHKLRNAREAAARRYLATSEGRNFTITNLVAEIANSYYELIALDNQLDILEKNIRIQSDALEIVKLQKQAARVTELAVARFEAQVLNTKSLEFGIRQQITETENRINFLLGRYPQHIPRNDSGLVPRSISGGIPAQLMANRPDIKQAEQELQAAKLDVSVARARFYPSLGISAAVGLRAFNPAYITMLPESVLYSMAGDIAGPLINRNAIKANYYTANAKQVQAVFQYERTVLNGYIQVVNQLAKIGNLEKSYELKASQVSALTRSVDYSNDLFRSARADYMEVLLTQRDALEAKFELIETRKQQMNAMVNIYHALGGGWN